MNALYLLHDDPDEFTVLSRYGKVKTYQKSEGWTVTLESERTSRIWCPVCECYLDGRDIPNGVHTECGSTIKVRNPKKPYMVRRVERENDGR